MKKKLIALVVGAAAAAPAMAMAADVTVYGRAHVSVDYLDDGADYSETNLSSNSSRLGFKGSHQINPDLKAFFQIEQEINFTTGDSEENTRFATRDTFVGLGSDTWGAIQLGRFDSPFKKARGAANLFGDQVGDMRNLTRTTGKGGSSRFDERFDNTVQYTTPNFGGFSAAVAYSMYEGQSAVADRDEDAFSMSLNYGKGPFSGALAYEKVEEDAGGGERDAFRAAGAYSLTDAFKVVGFYQTTDYDGSSDSAVVDYNSNDVYGLGGEFKLTDATAVKAMWMTLDSDADDADADMWVLGVEHKLDKAVRVYANYAVVDNDDGRALTPWGQGRTANPGSDQFADASGEKASGFTVGLRYDF